MSISMLCLVKETQSSSAFSVLETLPANVLHHAGPSPRI